MQQASLDNEAYFIGQRSLLHWTMKLTSLGNEAYFIGQRSLLRLPTKPTSFFYGF